MKIALVYDHVNKIGGAERILVALHELFPDAPLFTAVYDSDLAGWARDFQVRSSFMQALPLAKTYHELYPGVPFLAFSSLDLQEFDIVIVITSAEAKSVITGPRTLSICYCLTPTRYLWSHYSQYFKHKLLAFLSWPVVWFLRVWDMRVSARPDKYIAISETVAKRISKYYKRQAQVIYPPVDTEKFRPKASTNGRWAFGPDPPLADKVQSASRRTKSADKLESSYFLVVSRLVDYKRIDIAIEACNRLGLPLKIVGTGLEERKLKKLAGSTVEFLGNLTDQELIAYYQGCRALISPQEEDLGISAIEAQACGKPVIAYRGGGTMETVIAGKTGEFFYPQTVTALISVLEKLGNRVYNPVLCRKQALKFSKMKFKQQFAKYVSHTWKQYKLAQKL